MNKSGKKRGNSVVTRAELRSVLKSHDAATRESKKYTAINSGATASAGTVVPITVNIPQGDNISNRSGDQIRVTKFSTSTVVALSNAATSERVRFVWFVDHTNLGSTPAVTDVLDTASVVSFLNYLNDQSHRFKIIDDHMFTLNTSGGNSVSYRRTFKFSKAKVVNFLGTTGVQGVGHFYVLIISDIGVNNGAYSTSWDLRYQDA